MRERKMTLQQTLRGLGRFAAVASAALLVAAPMAGADPVAEGDDLVFGFDDRDGETGLGEGGAIAGEIDEKETDVRGGFVVATASGTVLAGWQMGEPDSVARKKDKATVKQGRDIAMYVEVTGPGEEALTETEAAVVRKCSVKASFIDDGGMNSAENLPDTGSWKVQCKKGWQRAFTTLSPAALDTLKAVLGSKPKVKGKGPGVDRDEILSDLDFKLF